MRDIGLGLTKAQYYQSSTKRTEWEKVAGTIGEMEDEKRNVNMVQLAKQGACTRWEVPASQLGHREVLKTSNARLKFLVKSFYDLLPTPENKNVWFRSGEKCLLCGGESNLNHVLANCKVLLSQVRYMWRHDQVLKEIARLTEAKVKNSRPQTQQERISFVKKGNKTKAAKSKVSPVSSFGGSKDLNLLVVLNKH